MTRTVPSLTLENPGDMVTSALWNAGPKALGDFYTAPPICRLTQTTAQSTTSGTYSALGMNVTLVDPDGGHSNSVNNSRYTCQVPGWYLVSGYAAWTNTAGQFDVYAGVAKNGALLQGALQVLQKSPDFSGINCEAMVQLAVGDYVEIWARQDSGGSVNTCFFSDLACSMNALWIHA